MADMCTMGGSDLAGGIPMSSPIDASMKDMKLPMPPQPAVVHGTGMAGSSLGITGKVNSMQQMK